MATAAQRAAAQAARNRRVAARNAPKAKPKGPQPGQNVSAPAIAAEGRAQAAENIAALNAQMPAATASFVNAQQGQIDEQAKRLDNSFSRDAQGIVRNEMGRTIGSPELEAQMRATAGSAMDYRPDQVQAATNVRELDAVQAQAARARIAQGQAASAGMVAGPQAFIGQAAMTNRPDIGADRVSAAQMSGVRDVDASRIRSGALGQSLMNRAIAGVESGGRLNAEANRDAVQAARQGFAARGMATGGASMAAELLNRDRYSRQRESQDLQFAGQTQAADLVRRQANQQAIMDSRRLNQAADITQNQTNAGFVQQANLANQDAGLRAAQLNQAGDQFNAGNQQAMNLANMSAQNQMGLAGYQGDINQGQFNAGNQQAMNLANMSALNQGSQFNAGNQQQANLANMSATNQIGLANQQRDMGLGQMSMDAQRLNQGANMEATGMNRAFMGQTANQLANTDLARGQYQLGLGDALLATDPYRQAMQPGMQMGQFAGGAAGNAILGQMGGMIDLSGNAATFNTNRQDSLYNNYRNNQAAMRSANMQAGAMNNAATMGMIGQIGGSIFSDKRMKKNIKPLGQAAGVLGLKAYEFAYKGEDQKRVGFMAQDVQKVLPEAVEVVEHQGKKRLAIKPAVIGAALAQELMAPKKAA